MRTAVLDANLLVLLVVGTLDPGLIRKHKRTEKFAVEDFDTLLSFLAKFGRLETTPHCFAEASNHLGQVTDPMRARLFGTLRAVLGKVVELYVPSSEGSASGCYLRLGLSDATLAVAASDGRVLVTNDLDLYLWVTNQGDEAFNFNHLRMGGWQ